jgi:hypothetical protein
MGFDPYIALGIAGTCCFIGTYFATLQGWLDATGWRFPAINLLGAMLVLVSLTDQWNLPSVILECFWGAASVYGVARALRR